MRSQKKPPEPEDEQRNAQVIQFPRRRIKRLVRTDGTVIELYHRWDEEAAERRRGHASESDDPACT